MDEQQIAQILDQIPLDILQQYVMQREQQEQAMQEQQAGQAGYAQGVPDEAAYTQMAYGGSLPSGYNPYLDVYGVPVGTTNPIGWLRNKRNKKK